MSPGSIARKRTPSAFASSAQIAVRWAKRRLAGAIGAPAGIGVDRRVAGDVDHQRAAPVARRGGKRAEQRLGQAERADEIDRERLLQLLAFGVGKQRQRDRAEARGIVDQHVEAAEVAGDLQRDRVDVVLPADVADNAVRRRSRRAVRFDRRWRCGRRRRRARPARVSCRTSASPRPEVPPVTATRSPLRSVSSACIGRCSFS